MDNFNEGMIELVDEMVTIFQKKKTNKKISERVQRGRAPASADEFETELAKLVERHTGEEFSIYVDYPISFNPTEPRSVSATGKARARTFYPDVAILKNVDNAPVLVGILEAKIDLGYLMDDWAEKREALFNDILAVQEVRMKLMSSGEPVVVKVAPDFVRETIVLTAQNHAERLETFRQGFAPIVLISNKHKHPNHNIMTDRNKYIQRIRDDGTNLGEWDRLRKLMGQISTWGNNSVMTN